jgi:hypothetical protein
MQNWKDKLLLIITLIVTLLGSERAYQYASRAPAEEALSSYEHSLTPDRDIRNTRYELLVTYEVTQDVQAPAGLPAGYTTTYIYTWPQPVVLFLRRPPTLQDILYVPPALKEKQQSIHSFTILSERRPILDDEPIEKKPEIEE